MADQFYLYLFEDSSRQYPLSGVAHRVLAGGVQYQLLSSVSHTPPTFSSDPSQARVTVRLRDNLDVAINYISHPPPSETTLRIFEVLATEIDDATNSLIATEVKPHWSGKIVRIAWRDSFRAVEIACKTRHEIHFSRETNTESLNPLCRFHLGDGRCPVNIEDFKETATVVDISADVSEPTVTVSGLAQTDTYYKAGMIRLANGDMRTVDLATADSGDKILTLSRAFPSTSVQIGDTVEVFAGDDLTQETCTVIYGSQTHGGADWGGWKLTPNRDFQKDGIR
jgi:hypothetical protein